MGVERARRRAALAAVAEPDGRPSSERSRHGHLWRLPDGTGLHAPPGELVRDPDTGQVCCHLCGRWFRALGSHLRVHGYTADAYRAALGLYRTHPLAAAEVSGQVSRRQRAAYQADSTVRERLAVGQEMARSGQLARRRQVSESSRPAAAQVLRERSGTLAAGRITQQTARQRDLADRLTRLGTADLAEYLTTEYRAGASLDELMISTGLGRVKLREALVAAGVQVRPTGVNSAAGKRTRSRMADVRAAERLGVTDVRGWLRDRYAAGWTLQRLGRAVEHSSPWVKARLASPEDVGHPNQGAGPSSTSAGRDRG